MALHASVQNTSGNVLSTKKSRFRTVSDVSRDALEDPRTQWYVIMPCRPHAGVLSHVPSLPRVVCDPVGLRSSLLLAFIHFAQMNGGPSHFQETFLHHKLTSIRLVNEGLSRTLSSPEAFCESIRQIATLAIVDLFLSPDLSAADTHMQGLVALMDRQPKTNAATPECVLEAEFTRRYFVL